MGGKTVKVIRVFKVAFSVVDTFTLYRFLKVMTLLDISICSYTVNRKVLCINQEKNTLKYISAP